MLGSSARTTSNRHSLEPRLPRLLPLILLAALAAPLGATVGVADAEANLTANRLEIVISLEYAAARLVVVGRDGVVARARFAAGDPLVLELRTDGDRRWDDGRCTWELRLDAVAEEPDERRRSRRFSGGLRVDQDVLSNLGSADEPDRARHSGERLVEHHFADDLGTAAELCAGCTDAFEPGSPAFGDEAITIIDSDFGSPGMVFLGSELTTDLESTGWELGVVGSGSPFYLADLSATGSSLVRPLQIEDDTPDDALYLQSTGRVGLGSPAPLAHLHIADPAGLYFEGADSEWEIDADDQFHLLLRDTGGGSGIGTVLMVEDDGALTPSGAGIGVFRDNPQAVVHISSPDDDGSAQVLVEERSLVKARRQLFRLENNGPPEFALVDQDLELTWKFGTRGTGFEINRGSSGQTEFLMRANGNLEITGTLSQGSSRSLKENIRAVDGRTVLERVNDLALVEWNYRAASDSERHLGPLAEDFHAAFGLGHSAERLAPGDTAGVALAAIQELSRVIDERDREIAEMRRELDELKRLVRGLAR